MIKKQLILYFFVITIPLFLSLLIWQSNRYRDLSREVRLLEQTQAEWVEGNKRIIADIAEYSSPERIEHIAQDQLELQKIRPERLLQVKIVEGGNGF